MLLQLLSVPLCVTPLVTGLGACAVEPAPAPSSASAATRPSDAEHDPTYAEWTTILRDHVAGDRFDYAALKKESARLDAVLARLTVVTPTQLEGWSRDERMAFWINVYNAHAIKLVVDAYPIESIRDLGTLLNKVWDKRFIDLPAFDPDGKGRKLSLDDVEHKILRPTFEDPRVHAAVNCASESCPALRAEAFTGKDLQRQLDEQTRAWLADPTRNRFEASEKRLRVSQIFDWFRKDFVDAAGSVPEWIAKYAPEKEATWLRATSPDGVKLAYLDYSWKLNDVVRER